VRDQANKGQPLLAEGQHIGQEVAMEQFNENVEEIGTLRITAWPDPVIDSLGFDPASGYVELCWLPTLGPSAVWAIRRLTAGLRANPDGYTIQVADLGAALGLGSGPPRSSAIVRTLKRLVHFEMARYEGEGTLAVRRHLPPLSRRHVERLVPALRRAHEQLTSEIRKTPDPEAA
jgi:hypothetical protein